MKVEIRYGMLFALLVVVYVLLEHVLGLNTDRHHLGQYTRLGGVLVPIVGVVVAVRARRAELGGAMSFSAGFKTGVLVAVIQTTLTTAWFWFYGSVVNPQFLETMLAFEMSKALASGASVADASAQIARLRELFSFPTLQIFQETIGIAYGAVVAAIAAALLRSRAARAIDGRLPVA